MELVNAKFKKINNSIKTSLKCPHYILFRSYKYKFKKLITLIRSLNNGSILLQQVDKLPHETKSKKTETVKRSSHYVKSDFHF